MPGANGRSIANPVSDPGSGPAVFLEPADIPFPATKIPQVLAVGPRFTITREGKGREGKGTGRLEKGIGFENAKEKGRGGEKSEKIVLICR